MSDAFIVRRGGSGGGGNFKVVRSSTVPSGVATQNTIVIVTDDAIHDVFFVNSATWTATVGDVAIECATSAGFDAPRFSLLKKPEVIILPTFCRQYTEAGWTPVEAYIYHVSTEGAGNWVKFSSRYFYIIQNGIVASGYAFTRMLRDGASSKISSSVVNEALKLTPAAGYYTNGVATASKAPLSGHTKLKVEVVSVSHNTSENYAELAIWTDAQNVGTEKLVNEARKKSVRITGAGTYSLDCSATGDSYVGTYHHNGSTAVSVTIKNMYIE